MLIKAGMMVNAQMEEAAAMTALNNKRFALQVQRVVNAMDDSLDVIELRNHTVSEIVKRTQGYNRGMAIVIAEMEKSLDEILGK